MEAFENSLAFWSSILGTAIALLGFINSSEWAAVLGLFLIAGSIAALLYAARQRQRLKLAAVKIEGRSIDSLNVASLERRLNRSLIVQDAEQVATIKGEDLVVEWRYRGYCRAPHESAIEFSIDTDNHIPYDRLPCYAYDLQHDPERKHRIRPVLLSSDGLSKKLAVPLLERLSPREPFHVLFVCKLPGCMKSGVEYYTSTASVAQDRIQKSTVHLVFVGDRPQWVRIYQCGVSAAIKLLKDMRPSHETEQSIEYTDSEIDVPAQSAQIYLFYRANPSDTNGCH
jgi:hypothetical protein